MEFDKGTKIRLLKEAIAEFAKTQKLLKSLQNSTITGSLRSRINRELQMNSIRLSWMHGEMDVLNGKSLKNVSTNKCILSGTIEERIKHNRELLDFFKRVKGILK